MSFCSDFSGGMPHPPVARALAGSPAMNHSSTANAASLFLLALGIHSPVAPKHGLTRRLVSNCGAGAKPATFADLGSPANSPPSQ